MAAVADALRGLSGEELADLASQRGWLAEPHAPSKEATVLGQMPLPGALVAPGTRVRIAWAKGARS